jgi:MFS family permease
LARTAGAAYDGDQRPELSLEPTLDGARTQHHRRTYGAIYEIALAISFTVVPFLAYLLTDNPYAFRFLALPGGLAITVVPVLVYLVLPESPRWHLRKGRAQIAVDIVNRIIVRCGNRVPPLTVEALGDHREAAREQLPPYWALFAPGQLRWTTVGILSGVCAGTAYFLISVLLPKALVDQRMAVSLSFGRLAVRQSCRPSHPANA